ncbi:efflux transporter outer membrane subunit [Amphritea sp. 1_MG-2023]|uniref:efflux transporter outer membrane subunit n=1 Tax=Amphritea sp. 1_MG-2023 TaxID=3062670 RepID=UPI0026E45932|nr:efflux transporter outer membrane subunit [Amphritea sp. 1_MG-2023]MDO6562803.1 efflux transporter outer membrane subunit [Amphritea sp. 1_MG-2023]
MKPSNRSPAFFSANRFTRLLLLLCLPLAGCSSSTPETMLIDVPTGQFSQAGSAALNLRWWEALKDAELQALERIALEANPDLLATQARLDQAAALARKTGAQLYPQVSVGLSANRTDDSDSYSASLAASYELDLWGGLAATTESARESWLASREALDVAAITLTAEVADTWYEMLEQAGQIALLTQQQQTNQQMLELIELRFDRGKVQATDVLQQRQLVESSEASLADARADQAVLEHQLMTLLGQSPTHASLTLPSGTLIELPPLPATGLPAELVQQRPDVRQAFHLLRAAQADIAIAVADRFPDMSFSASLTSTAGGLNQLFSDWVSVLAGELLGPVFDAGQRVAEVERSDAAARAALHDYSSAVLSALTEVEDALVREQQQHLRLQSLDRQLQLTAAVVERSRYNYTKGTADYLDVLDALRTHQALQRDQLTAHRTLLSYRIALHRALAGGWLADSLAPLTLATPLTHEIVNL